MKTKKLLLVKPLIKNQLAKTEWLWPFQETSRPEKEERLLEQVQIAGKPEQEQEPAPTAGTLLELVVVV